MRFLKNSEALRCETTSRLERAFAAFRCTTKTLSSHKRCNESVSGFPYTGSAAGESAGSRDPGRLDAPLPHDALDRLHAQIPACAGDSRCCTGIRIG